MNKYLLSSLISEVDKEFSETIKSIVLKIYNDVPEEVDDYETLERAMHIILCSLFSNYLDSLYYYKSSLEDEF